MSSQPQPARLTERTLFSAIVRPLARSMRRVAYQLTPRQINGIGAAAFVALLLGSALYRAHFELTIALSSSAN